MRISLTGKRALVTGSGRGIGRSIALGLAETGADVAVNAVHPENCLKVVDEIQALGRRSIAVPGDVNDSESRIRIVKDTLAALGGIDILVNNAGIVSSKKFEETSQEDYETLMGVNLKATYFCSQLAGREMIKRGGGRIINISSIGGINPFPERSLYAISKAGVIMLTKELALEWAKHNITVNAIAPGFFKTDLLMSRLKIGALNEQSIIRRVPMGRFGELEEIADLSVFLASESARYITGQTVVIDGGYSCLGYFQE
jgi:NAD(P)-dependent dehydrogenase (short-subunit alcohol dehydrogenase family)